MPQAQNSHLAYGDPQSLILQGVGLFATHMKRNETLSRLYGPMPKGYASATSTIEKQTTKEMPFVRNIDLGKGRGDEIRFNLVNPYGAIPSMGSAYAQGRGSGLSISEDRLRVNQARFAVPLGDTMTNIRSPVEFRQLGRPVAQETMNRYIDQTMIVHAAGARGSVFNLSWCIPLASDSRYEEIMVNRVRAPTKNRHFMVNGGGASKFAVNAGEVDIATGDVFSLEAIDSLRAIFDGMVLAPPPVKFPGDPAASDSPLRVILVTPIQYNQIRTDPNFRSIQQAAFQRASYAGAAKHPIFTGDVGIWNNFLVVQQNIPIRFFAGDTLKYCAEYESETESSAVVPAAFGTDFAIDRAIILGGSSVAEALASSEHSGAPFFWSEEKMDHGDKIELLIGAVRGVSKIRFKINMGDRSEFTDYGAAVLDTVVPINQL